MQAVKKAFKEINIKIVEVVFYTDSKVVLGYYRTKVDAFKST